MYKISVQVNNKSNILKMNLLFILREVISIYLCCIYLTFKFFDSVYGFSFAGLKIRYDLIKADVIKVIIKSFHTPNQIHY